MSRSTFFLLAGLISFLFGGAMILATGPASHAFGVEATEHHRMFFRAVGEAIVAMGLLNVLVHRDEDSATLRSVLMMNVAYHTLGLAHDAFTVAQQTLAWTDILGGVGAHVFIGLGSAYFAAKVVSTHRSVEVASTNPALPGVG